MSIAQDMPGLELDQVIFVRDYVQLVFDRPIFSMYASWSVTKDGVETRSGSPGARDLLCDQLGRSVVRATVDDDAVTMHFDGGAAVSVSLRPEDATGPEALQFTIGEKIYVF